MRKSKELRKITIAMGLAVAMTVATGINAKSALATGYLAAPTLSTTSGAFQFSVNSNYDMYATGNSSYGNTIPTPSQIMTTTGYTGPSTINSIKDGVNSTGANVPTFYDPTSLNLQLLNSINTPFTENAPTGGVTVTGNVMSNVFAVGSKSSMPGAVPGELVFTYQFNVTGITSNNNTGLTQATVSFLNEPNGMAYQLGAGINGNSTTGSYINVGPSLSGNLTSLTAGNLSGTVDYGGNGTVSQLTYNSTTPIAIGSVSPQFFIASNALYYGMGQMNLQGSGTSFYEPVFVPNTPEPATLILFGTGLAFLGFMALRRKENILNI